VEKKFFCVKFFLVVFLWKAEDWLGDYFRFSVPQK